MNRLRAPAAIPTYFFVHSPSMYAHVNMYIYRDVHLSLPYLYIYLYIGNIWTKMIKKQSRQNANWKTEDAGHIYIGTVNAVTSHVTL